MICQFEKIIYPPDVTKVDASSYVIALYRPCEKIRDTAGNAVTQVKAVGYCLPLGKKLRYDMQGHWSKNPKHGIQFEVESYNEVIIPTKEGIIAYLASGQIKGIGPKLAERIYDAFGTQTMEVLDKEPEQLLSISGISEGKLEKIRDSYLANRGARDVVAFLAPHGITPNRAVRLYREYGDQTMDIVRNHPYQLCEIAGIGFTTADKIAMSMGFDKLSPERVDEGILYTLADAEGKGHLCMQKRAFLKACLKVLNTPQLTEQMVGNRATRLIYDGRLVMYRDQVYRAKTAEAEESLAKAICYQMKHQKAYAYGNLDAELDQEEQKLKIRFAPEQREAVKMALTHGLCIITGGPGTGKTMIQKALLDIYHRKHPGDEIICCAPTGRAARRMEQSTGYPASTVHKALGLVADEDDACGGPDMLEADLVLVDEVSMLDIFLAGHLFDSVKYGAKVILVGDADQLPSVGPGAVLSEMIASGCIPVVRLDKVYRQDAGSRIASNAKLIRHGNHALEYGDDFQLIESSNLEQSAEIIEKLYLQETAAYGVDNVALLTPYRQKTETGVNALNLRLRELVNPPSPAKKEAVLGKRIFRSGDKVMQTKNHEEVNNGDVGYITGVSRYGNDTAVNIDFGDGRTLEYDSSELDMLDLGYASTIHKSQGSEYQSVIINLQCAHSIMLTRPLIYTAITRGKTKVIIVGERRALSIAIKRTDTEKRGTQLAIRIQEFTK
ncbi:MAG: ATP-dependent RecD-like DNA helicase [Eubacteriales bacterium]|nr:ATP-dependent RecD-like DNA helicase [Eubacteriales bacterium]